MIFPVFGFLDRRGRTRHAGCSGKRSMSMRILVVGRDVHAREGLPRSLSFDGQAVAAAEDIGEGFAGVAEKEFDLFLRDDVVRFDGPAPLIGPALRAFARLRSPATSAI